MRRVRVLLGILGLDQHELGAMAVARMLRDAGIEVIYAGRFNLPETLVQGAVEEGVDLLGISCHSWEYLYYIPELMELIRKRGLRLPVVVGGSVVTPEDERWLKENGVAAVFGPGAQKEEIIRTVTSLIEADPVKEDRS
jgi:methylmalonyl-CoA mutase C-terminal domain/subunit